MVVRVPASVNVAKLIEPINLSKTQRKNLKEKTYYFLSVIAQSNDNYRLYQKSHGFVKVSSELMKKKLGNKYYYQILELLSNHEEPIIESDESWYSPKAPDTVGFCKGYRLTEKYNTGELIHKTISDKFQDKDKALLTQEIDNQLYLDTRFDFLHKEFKTNKLTFHPRVYDCIRLYGYELLNGCEKENEYQQKIIYNIVGRLLLCVEGINSRITQAGISATNHRFNSVITSIRRLIRPYLLCNDNQLVELDIISSQPYILSTIIDNKFLDDNCNGFNLQSIYPEIYDDLKKGLVKKDEYPGKCDNRYVDYLKSLFNKNTSKSKPVNEMYASFMWCKKYSYQEIKSIHTYINTSFTLDFYSECIKSATSHPIFQSETRTLSRDDFKKSMMYILFEHNQAHRRKNQNIQLFRQLYPGVDRYIRDMHHIIGPDKFSLLLQRVESYLILDNVCRCFKSENPKAPIFTIHDAMLTSPDYITDLHTQTEKIITAITGKPPGLKVKYSDFSGTPSPGEVAKDLKKILSVKTLKHYQKISGQVFEMNVRAGKEFLNS